QTLELLFLLGFFLGVRLGGFLLRGFFFVFLRRRRRRVRSRFQLGGFGRRGDQRGVFIQVHFFAALDGAHGFENRVGNVVRNKADRAVGHDGDGALLAVRLIGDKGLHTAGFRAAANGSAAASQPRVLIGRRHL